MQNSYKMYQHHHYQFRGPWGREPVDVQYLMDVPKVTRERRKQSIPTLYPTNSHKRMFMTLVPNFFFHS